MARSALLACFLCFCMSGLSMSNAVADETVLLQGGLKVAHQDDAKDPATKEIVVEKIAGEGEAEDTDGDKQESKSEDKKTVDEDQDEEEGKKDGSEDEDGK